MIIWFILFFIILAVSLVLAYVSMKDYQEIPRQEKEYGVYLIRRPQFLTSQMLNTLFELTKGKLFSFERLFKGRSSAIVIFGPKKILEERFSEIFGLLEIEDYTNTKGEVIAWEVEKRSEGEFSDDIFQQFPQLEEDEKFWWQIIISGSKGQIRAVFLPQNKSKQKELLVQLEGLGSKLLTKVPRPFTSDQLFQHFRQRIFTPANSFKLTAVEVIRLIGLLRK